MTPGTYNNVQVNAKGEIIATGTVAYPSVVATGSDVNTGTNNTKYVTPLAIEDSAYVKNTYVDAKVADEINEGTTTIAPSQNAVFNALATRLVANSPITGATKTKITYDADGLVTAGADATTADIADSTNKRYCTDAEKTVIGNTSGTNTGDPATNAATPSLTNTTNVGSSTAYEFRSIKFGVDTVIYSGQVDITPTLTNTSTVLEIALAHASNFGSDKDASGTGVCMGLAGVSGGIRANVTNNTIEFVFISDSVDLTSQTYSIMAMYKVI